MFSEPSLNKPFKLSFVKRAVHASNPLLNTLVMKKTINSLVLILLLTTTLIQTAQAQFGRRWSPQAKGAVIGGVAGGAAGAVINKRNRVVGGVIGGVAGTAAGYAIGKGVDNRKKAAARVAAAEREAAEARREAALARQEAAAHK